MVEVSACVVCDSSIRQLKRAAVAPFLAKKMWDRSAFNVDLVGCDSCGFRFYNPRLDDGDLQKLYDGYRDENYLRLRHSFEPWYTEKLNTGIASHDSYEGRRATLSAILKTHINGRKIKRVLDFGGDRGDLVAGLIYGAEDFVYDISGIPAIAGVTSVKDPSVNADLIISSNVLEHVGFPRDLVCDMLKAAPVGGLIFLEVPAESPFEAKRIAKRIAQTGISAIMRPIATRAALRPSALYMMHEHINYFTERSLRALLCGSGGALIASGTYPVKGAYGSVTMAWCIGYKLAPI